MTRLPPILARVALSLCMAASATAAEPGDRDAPTPEAVLRDTRVADGFVMELVAMEPAVVDPVAVTFDEHGTPFVVEYRDYPSGPPAGSPPLSRVVRLNDADGDGRYESSTPVAEHLPFSQGIVALRGGLLDRPRQRRLDLRGPLRGNGALAVRSRHSRRVDRPARPPP